MADGEGAGNGESLPTLTKELVDLVVDYAKQETVEPIKGLGKTVLFGVLGAVLIGVGTTFLALGGLRALQTETTAFDENLSWAPYAIVTVALIVGAVLSWSLVGRTREAKS
jgi:putative superfamily III holin-X